MAFGLFKRRVTVPVAHALGPTTQLATAANISAAEVNPAKAILELLELGGMIRQIERAARSVAGGADNVPIRVRKRHWGGFRAAYKL